MSYEGMIAVYAACVSTLAAMHQIYSYVRDRRFLRIDVTEFWDERDGEYFEVVVSNIGHRPVTLIEWWWEAYKWRRFGLVREYDRGTGFDFEGNKKDRLIKLEPGSSVKAKIRVKDVEAAGAQLKSPVPGEERPIRYISIIHSQSKKPSTVKIVLSGDT